MAAGLAMKHAHTPQIRMAYFDRLIREGKFPNCTQIAQKFEVSRKTIQRDIEYMRELGAPLKYDQQRRGYYYTEPNYFLPVIPITQSDIFAFVVNEQILKQYEEAPYYEEIKRVVEKITHFLPDDVFYNERAEIFSFTRPPFSTVKSQHFEILQKAAFEERSVIIQYYSLHTNETCKRQVDPYVIRNQAGNWYLIGHCHLRDEVRIFALNRILAIETTDIDFFKPSSFSVDDFLKQSFGIYRDEKTYHIKLKFSPYQSRWIRERQWHQTQKLTELEDGGSILEMDVQGLVEINRWVLQYGAEVEVVEPGELREKIILEIKKMKLLYKIGV